MKEDFFKYQAQTSKHPLALAVSRAKGCYIYDTDNKKYLDFIAGVSANTLGHNHPEISAAIKKQTDTYTYFKHIYYLLKLNLGVYPQKKRRSPYLHLRDFLL